MPIFAFPPPSLNGAASYSCYRSLRFKLWSPPRPNVPWDGNDMRIQGDMLPWLGRTFIWTSGRTIQRWWCPGVGFQHWIPRQQYSLLSFQWDVTASLCVYGVSKVSRTGGISHIGWGYISDKDLSERVLESIVALGREPTESCKNKTDLDL